MSRINVDKITGATGTASGAPITLSGDTATLGSGVAMAANHSGVKTALNASGSASIYAARAWVNFNGIGTVAIRSSGNISSITDNGTGDYTVNFTTAMPDANYCISGICQRNRSIGGGSYTGIITMPLGSSNYGDAFNTSSIRIQTLYTTGSMLNVDPLTINVAIFR